MQAKSAKRASSNTANILPAGNSGVNKPCMPTAITANNSPGANNGVYNPLMPTTKPDHINMAGLKQPYGFVKTTCNCCVSEKIPKTNDVIRMSDTDKPVSK